MFSKFKSSVSVFAQLDKVVRVRGWISYRQRREQTRTQCKADAWTGEDVVGVGRRSILSVDVNLLSMLRGDLE